MHIPIIPMPISFQYHYCYSIILLSIYYFTTADGTQLILVNNCKEDVWPGILGNAGQPSPKDGGFLLPTGQEAHLQLPRGWSGRIWGRQGCIFDPETGTGSCQTGDCAGLLQCKGIGGALPATLVEMTLGSSQTPTHFYDVSLVDGFNLPISMRPVGGSGGGGGGCGVAACEADLNSLCPSALVLERNGKVVGCKSACLGARTERYCCSGEYANPEKCKPSVFARIFKAACPEAYSYAYDESSGLKTCKASRYSITFCPPKA